MKLDKNNKYADNPRQITEKQFGLLNEHLNEFGDLGGVVYCTKQKAFVGGNMRSEIMNGAEIEIVERFDKPTKNKTLAHGFINFGGEKFSYREVAFNKSEFKKACIVANNDGGSFDWDILANNFEMSDLESWGLQLPVWDEVTPETIEEDEAAVGEMIDKAAELQKKWQTASGQLWKLGKHFLICGDSSDAQTIEKLLQDKKIETVFFDPPFDSESDILNLRWNCTDVLMFSDHRHLLDCVDGWGKFRNIFCWDGVTSWYVKGQPLARGKFCLWFGESGYNENGSHYGEPDKAKTITNTRGTYDYVPDERGKHLSTVFQSPNTQQFNGHKHSKPTEWLKMLIANCTNGIVFDPFAGSGSAMVACEALKRVCLSIEILPENVAVILERMSKIGLKPELVGRRASE